MVADRAGNASRRSTIVDTVQGREVAEVVLFTRRAIDLERVNQVRPGFSVVIARANIAGQTPRAVGPAIVVTIDRHIVFRAQGQIARHVV